MEPAEHTEVIIEMLKKGAGVDIAKTQSEIVFSIMDLAYSNDLEIQDVVNDYQKIFRVLYGSEKSSKKKTT